jgi:hypothetical protein
VKGKEAEQALEKGNWKIQNDDIVKFLLTSEIVYETSPPKSKPLKELLERSVTGALVGSPLGYIVTQATDYPLLVTIPAAIVVVGLATNVSKAAGIIIIGAANGISEGLKNGLSKRVEEWIKPPNKKKSDR